MKTTEYFIIISVVSVLIYFVIRALTSKQTLTEKLLKKITADIRSNFTPVDLGMHRVPKETTILPKEMQVIGCGVNEPTEGVRLYYRDHMARDVIRISSQAAMKFRLVTVDTKTQSQLSDGNKIFQRFVKYSGKPFVVTLTDKEGKFSLLTVTRLHKNVITTA